MAQQIAIGRAMSPKAMAHPKLGPSVRARYHSQMACLLLQQQDAAGALEQLIAKSRLEPFYEHESIWFLQCLTLLGHTPAARKYAQTLYQSRQRLQPLARRQLDEVYQALSASP